MSDAGRKTPSRVGAAESDMDGSGEQKQFETGNYGLRATHKGYAEGDGTHPGSPRSDVMPSVDAVSEPIDHADKRQDPSVSEAFIGSRDNPGYPSVSAEEGDSTQLTKDNLAHDAGPERKSTPLDPDYLAWRATRAKTSADDFEHWQRERLGAVVNAQSTLVRHDSSRKKRM